jgi:hypothetical protein
MKNVLLLLDGNVASGLLDRLVLQNISHSFYDIVYTNTSIIPKNYPKSFTFYNFDPSSHSKLEFMIRKVKYYDILVVLASKSDTLAVIDNIEKIEPSIYFTVYNAWNIKFENKHIINYDSIGILSNGLIEKLPNVPVIAQNIGLKQGEIMEINIPFGSPYAYRYVGSITQKQWKIFAIYRHNNYLESKSTSILKPNDTILIIGKPKVLLQVYSSISQSLGHFPMPFGNNIYVYIDLYIQSKIDAINCIKKAIFLNNRLNNQKLIVKIVRPTIVSTINTIKEKINSIDSCILEFDYNVDISTNILSLDTKKYDIGLIVLTRKQLQYKYIQKQIIDLKIAVFKVGNDTIDKSTDTKVILNNTKEYEQISPIIFDITSQIQHDIYLLNSDPIGDNNRDKLVEHFNNLCTIFNQKIELVQNKKNPIKQLKKFRNTLQIMPLRNNMFKKRIFDFLSTDSDLLAYDFKYINQILIPIIEDR